MQILPLESIDASYCSIFKITHYVIIHDICHPFDCQVAPALTVCTGVHIGPHCSTCVLPEAAYFGRGQLPFKHGGPILGQMYTKGSAP